MSEADQSLENAMNAGLQRVAEITKSQEGVTAYLGQILPVEQGDFLLFWLNGEDEQEANLGLPAGVPLGPWKQDGIVRYQSTSFDKCIDVCGFIMAGGHFVRSTDDELANIDTMRLLTAASPSERQVLDRDGELLYPLYSMIATYEVFYTNRKD